MPIADTIRKAGPFLGDGTTTEFPFEFRVIDDEDILVLRTPLNDLRSPVVLVQGVDYTLYRQPGLEDVEARGAVILNEPLATGMQLNIVGNAAFHQLLRLLNQGPYNAEDVLRALDRLTVLCQQLRETLTRAIVIPPQYNVEDFGNLVEDIVALAEVAQQIAQLAQIIPTLLLLAEQLGETEDLAALLAQAVTAANTALAAAAAAQAAADQATDALNRFIAKFTISTELPSGGEEGDIWFRIAN